MEEILLGFQLRSKILQLKQWESRRRETYLLRENIKNPLSVDRAVWAECGKRNVLPNLFIDYCDGEHCAPNGLSLYNVRNELLLRQTSFFGDAVLIGLTIVNDIESRAQELKLKRSILDIPYSLEQIRQYDWRCVGYDVADYWLYSCLMNCGFDVNDKIVLSQRFADDLNQYGLFSLVETAQQFRISCDSRIRDHAPFAVYGIWWKE